MRQGKQLAVTVNDVIVSRGEGGGYFYPILIDDGTKIHRAFFS